MSTYEKKINWVPQETPGDPLLGTIVPPVGMETQFIDILKKISYDFIIILPLFGEKMLNLK